MQGPDAVEEAICGRDVTILKKHVDKLLSIQLKGNSKAGSLDP